jgi:HAD superfamily hydrolase (TIGR01509 family)
MKASDYRAIIFDLGGVLINLDYQLTRRAFENLGINNINDLYSQAAQNDLFDDFETGQISSFHFINRLLDLLPKGCNANQVAHAWDAMILDFPIERMNLVRHLQEKIPVFLLSNTNDLHMAKVRRELKKVTELPLECHFTKVYLSQEIHLRKPNKEAFEYILNENDLKPEEVLFIDDSVQHILSAQKLGLATIHLTGELLDHSAFS